MMKQTLLLSLFVLLLPVGAWADVWQDPETKVNYEYTVGKKEASVKAGSFYAGSPDATGNIAILAKFTVDGNEYSVTTIGKYAFCACTGLTSVTIPSSVTTIGDLAFRDCTCLTSVTIPSSVTDIGNYAFSNSSLTSVTIPEGVTSISSGVFRSCTGLTSVTIPEGVTSIDISAFYGCSSLTSVTIPSSVTTIGKSAFSGCSGLTSVTIPSSVTSIGDYTFSGCSGLTSVTIPSSVTNVANGAFRDCTGLTSVTIPSSVTSIGNTAFSYCYSLTSVTIPEGVTSIDNSAFEHCKGLTSVTIPSSVTSIGEYAFYNCSGLTAIHISDIEAWCGIQFDNSLFENSSANPLYYAHHLYLNGDEVKDLIIPSGVKRIGSSVFSGCTGLTSVTIPSSVTNIGESVFSGCNGLTSIEVESDNKYYDSRENCNAIIETASNTLIQGCQNTVIPSSVTSIGDYAFQNYSDLTSVTIPEGVTSIGNYAFQGCTGLTSVISLIQEPFAISVAVFYTYSNATTLYVPKGTIEAYKAKSGWKNFKNIEELAASSSLTLTVTDGNGTDISDGVSITWLDADGKEIGTGKSLNGIEDGTELYYSVTLGEELGRVYREVKMRKVMAEGEAVTCQLERIGELTLHGVVAGGEVPLAGADVSLTQWLNGKYEYAASMQTDETGAFTLKAYSDSTLLTIAAKGYVDKQIERSRLYSAELGTIELQQAQGMVVNLLLSYQEAVREGGEPMVQSWYSDTRNIAYTVRNVTKGEDVANFAMQMGDIVLPFGSEAGDRIQVTLRSLNDKFAEVSGEGVVSSEGMAEIALTLVGYGGIEATVGQKADEQLLVMLYDSDGRLAGSLVTSSSRATFSSLKAGSYTLVAMGYNGAVGSIGDLADLNTFGLVEDMDYVKTVVTVQDGIICSVAIGDVPELDASKFEYTSLNTSYLPNKSQMTVNGSFVTLTARVDFKAQYANEVSDVKVVVDIPEGCEFIANSVVIGTKALPHTLDGSQLTITLSEEDIDSRIRFCMMPKRTGTFTSTAYSAFNCRGEKRQAIGTAVFEATAGSINVPSLTASKSITVNGIAAPHATVDVYDADQLIGTTTALGDGKWRTEVELYKPYNLSTHAIYAKYETADGIKATTESKECLYDMTYLKAKSVTMLFYNSWLKKNVDVTFDFETGKTSSNNYMFYTATNITFIADLTANNTTQVSGVTFYIHTTTKEVRTLKGFFDENLGRWVAVDKFVSYNLPVNLSVSVDANYSEPLMDSDQIAAAFGTKEDVAEELHDLDVAFNKKAAALDGLLEDMWTSEDFDITSIIGVLSEMGMQQSNELSEEEKENVANMSYEDWNQYVTSKLESFNNEESALSSSLDLIDQEMQRNSFELLGEGTEGVLEYSTCEGVDEESLVAEGYLKIPSTSGGNVYILSSDNMTRIIDFGSNQAITINFSKPMAARRRANAFTDYLDRIQNKFSTINTLISGALQFWDDEIRAQERLLEEHTDLMYQAEARMERSFWWGDKNAERDLNEYRRYRDIAKSQQKYLKRIERARCMKKWLGRLTGPIQGLLAVYDGYNMYNDLNEWDQLQQSVADIEAGASCEERKTKAGNLLNTGNEHRNRVRNGYITVLAADLVGLTSLAVSATATVSTGGLGVPLLIANIGALALSMAADHWLISRSDGWQAEIRRGIANLPKCNDEGVPTGGAAPINSPIPPTTTPPVTPIHDPSGYVYEAVPTNRVEGVTASIYFDQQKPTLWDAADFSQVNPQVTDETGLYQWDVPQGMWQVRFEKSGYETTQTEWLPVPPPQLEINIPMSEAVAPQVVKASGTESGITLTFSKYMKPATMEKSGRISATVNGKNAGGDVEMLNAEEDPYNNKVYASKVKFVPTKAFKTTDEVVVTVKKEVESYADKQMEQDFVATVKIEPEISGIECDSIIAVDYQSEGVLEIAVLPASATKGRTVQVASTSPMIATADGSVTLDSDGKARIAVSGNLPGGCSLRLLLDGTDIEKNVEVNVVLAEKTVKTPKASKRTGSTIEEGYLLWLTSSTSGATIYYTLDGSCPCNEDTRKKYTGPFVLPAGNVLLKVIATRAGMDDSDVATFTYTVEGSTVDISSETASQDVMANLSDGQLTISGAEGGVVRVFDLLGRELASQRSVKGTLTLQVPQAESYIVSVTFSNGQTVVRKVVVK